MGSVPEPTPKETQNQYPEASGAKSGRAAPEPEYTGPSQRVLTGAPGDKGDAAARSMAVPGLRGQVLYRAQHGYGNRFAQRLVQRKSGSQAPADLEIRPPGGGGQLFDTSTREALQTYYQADLSDVRVHTDRDAGDSARSLHASAYTTGRDIYFAPGMYSPGTDSGRRLLAHEVAHVVQQQEGEVPTRISAKRADGIKVGAPDDPLESRADVAADGFAGGKSVDEQQRKQPATQGPVVQRQSATHDIIQREDPKPDDGIDSKTFYEKYRAMIWGDFLEPFSEVHFDTSSPYAYWLFGKNDSFTYSTFVPISTQGWSTLVATAAPGDVEAAIRRGRDAGFDGLAPDEYNKNVAAELRGVYLPRVQESLNRLSPQFVAAGYLTMKKKSQDGKTLSQYMQQPAPDASTLVPSRPLDRYAIVGLTGGTNGSQLQINYQQYEADGLAATAESQLKKVRPVRFMWQADQGVYTWVRVTDPPNASAEEVANELYGDPASAGGIIPAAPLFGFKPGRLTPKHFEEWKAAAGDKATAGIFNEPLSSANDLYTRIVSSVTGIPLVDPAIAILKTKSSDEAVLNQAKGLQPTGADKEKIIARLRVCLQLLDQISGSAAAIGGAQSTGGLVRQKIEQRIQALTASTDPTAAMTWDAHSQAESQVLKAVANGVKTAADLYRGFNIPTNASGGKDLPSYVRDPLRGVVEAYTNVAEVAELVDTANERLKIAEEKSKLYPIEVLEGILAYCRELLKDKKKGFGAEEDDLGQAELRKKETDLRERLTGLRELILRDPQEVQALITDIQTEVADLQDKATMVDSMSAIVTLWNFLLSHRSFVGEFTGKNTAYTAAMDVLSAWYFKFYPVYLLYKSDRADDRAAGRVQLKELQKSGPELQQALATVQKMATTDEERERWITLGLKIAAVIGIGLLTAGIGSFVSEGLLVGAGWGLTTEGVIGATLVSSGVEAASFTGLSTVILGKDPNQSLLATFLENWALFGALKGLSIGLEAALAEKSAIFAVGRGGNITAGLAVQIGYSLAKADSEAHSHGGKLSDEQAQSIVLENLIVFIGTAIVARYAAGKFFEGAAARGEEAFRGSFLSVDQARLNALDAARGLSKSSTADQAKRALALDSEALQKEIDVMKAMEDFARANPAKANLLHIDPAKLAEARGVSQQQIENRTRASLALDLKDEGGSLFTCPRGKLAEKTKGYSDLGDKVTLHSDEATGEKAITVTTKDGQTMTIREQTPAEANPADPARFKLTSLFDSLHSDEAKAEFSAILQESEPAHAQKVLEKMAESKEGLEATLIKRARTRAARVPPDVRIAAAKAVLVANGFLSIPTVQGEIAAGNVEGLRGRMAEFLAQQANASDFPAAQGYKVLAGIDIVQQFGDFKTVADAEAAHPGQRLPLYELDGKVWRRVTDLDVLVLQQDSSGLSRVARLEQVKSGKQDTGTAARAQIAAVVDVLAKIAGGDTSFQIHLNRKQNITGQIDVTGASAAPTQVRGPQGKEGFDVSLGLTTGDMNNLARSLIEDARRGP
jgi:hypothetical protein